MKYVWYCYDTKTKKWFTVRVNVLIYYLIKTSSHSDHVNGFVFKIKWK